MNQDFYVRDDRINSDHADILQLLCSVENFINTEPSKEEMLKLLNESAKSIKQHIIIHFYDEEALFKVHNMPQEYVSKHIEEHTKIRNKIIAILSTDIKDKKREEIKSLAREIISMVEQHILTIDKEMNEYLPT